MVLASGHVTADEEARNRRHRRGHRRREIPRGRRRRRQAFRRRQALRAFLASIERQEARELIYGTLIEAAITDTVEGRESELLEWLAKEWKIEVTYDEPAEPKNQSSLPSPACVRWDEA